jgi:hypothetical protein
MFTGHADRTVSTFAAGSAPGSSRECRTGKGVLERQKACRQRSAPQHQTRPDRRWSPCFEETSSDRASGIPEGPTGSRSHRKGLLTGELRDGPGVLQRSWLAGERSFTRAAKAVGHVDVDVRVSQCARRIDQQIRRSNQHQSPHRRLIVDSNCPSPGILDTKAAAPASKHRCLSSGSSSAAVNTMIFDCGFECAI